MQIPFTEPRRYAIRLLNPFHGVAQIIDNGQARAVSYDGVDWQIQIRSEIYKTPWSSLLHPRQSDRYFVYGTWSQTDGLVRVPVHPSLYQDHVAQSVQDLMSHLEPASRQLPFPLEDTIELWLMDSTGKLPVALLASQQNDKDIPVGKQLHWVPADDTDTPFVSAAFAAEQAASASKSQTQDYLLRAVRQRCHSPYLGLWLERRPDGSGQVLLSHAGNSTRRNESFPASAFPCCLLDEHWQDDESTRLVADYIDWLAPLLLTLPLPRTRRCELEIRAQQRPLAVHRYHRLYPEVVDETLLNKILVEAVMRKAATPA